MSDAAFAGVDWGTSALRVWAFDAAGLVLAERRSDEGMASLSPADFAGVLQGHLAALALPTTVPVLMCGMVGSRQGWQEARYVDCPAGIDGLVSGAVRVTSSERDIRILPGLALRDPLTPDVMRGEETKLLGLLQGAPEFSGLICMPGTHTKWVRLEQGRVATFRTTMVGELYALLTTHSILRLNIDADRVRVEPDAHFRDGVADGLTSPGSFTSRLFQLRADGLLNGTGGEVAAARLSGFLIGVGLADGLQLASTAETAVWLLAEGRLTALYAAALSVAGRAPSVVDANVAAQRGLLIAARHLWPARFI